MDPKALLTIAASTKDEFVEAQEQNHTIKQMIYSQKVLIDDYAESMPDIDQIEKDGQELDLELQKIDEQLLQSQEILLQLLQTKPAAEHAEQGEIILKSILKTFEQRVIDLIKEAVSRGFASVDIFKMIELEGEIRKLIENLESKDMYPETEDQHQKREDKSKIHTAKLAELLTFLKKIAQESQNPQSA